MPTTAAEGRVLLQFHPQASMFVQLGLGTGISHCWNLVGFYLHQLLIDTHLVLQSSEYVDVCGC